MDLAFDIAQPVLHEAAGITNALVVDRWTQFTNHEIQKGVGAKIAQRVIEVLGEVVLEGAQDTRATVVGKPDSHKRHTIAQRAHHDYFVVPSLFTRTLTVPRLFA